MKLMLTCEHASNRLPASFKKAVPAEILKTHRAYDIGACAVFRKLIRFAKPEFHCEGKFSRLFVDLNRTITNKSAFSEYHEALDVCDKAAAEKAKAQATAYWMEYRDAIEKFVESALKPKTRVAKSKPTVVHLGIHSFTPELNGKVRNADIGILYDPARPQECAYAQLIKDEIKRLYPTMKVRFNYPYKGSSDGLTTTLRKKFGQRYVGIEIEINQKFFQR
ncbi:MAG: N-formylglutamate amidohydrolase [Fibrobacter sp.]|uniref:N-formylglutamate amidohydrolase n=1 Tax=Fibrobacter sp. TaxID=35828 RepID=UPI001B0B82B6|nr:N-formylglutamate amidohydrolase [Fibrobacter sp.]MBO7062451.1 N-formylglutamate amidohydrolase [Fibrobacter sp.]MBO7103916.1 N-formylglutamate amidohydrolase [Fibrobacter sp.]